MFRAKSRARGGAVFAAAQRRIDWQQWRTDSITLENIAEIAATGVGYASSSALTYSAPSLDVALDIEM